MMIAIVLKNHEIIGIADEDSGSFVEAGVADSDLEAVQCNVGE